MPPATAQEITGQSVWKEGVGLAFMIDRECRSGVGSVNGSPLFPLDL